MWQESIINIEWIVIILFLGEEILDNYGYHYAVMPREERQRKLQSQYYFQCGCVACRETWPVYTGLSTAAVPTPGTQPDQVGVYKIIWNSSC